MPYGFNGRCQIEVVLDPLGDTSKIDVEREIAEFAGGRIGEMQRMRKLSKQHWVSAYQETNQNRNNLNRVPSTLGLGSIVA